MIAESWRNRSSKLIQIHIFVRFKFQMRDKYTLIKAPHIYQVFVKMPQRDIKYAVVYAFSGEAFKGNPSEVDKKWMLSVNKEFNIPVTAFLSRHVSDSHDAKSNDDDAPWFYIWWFTSTVQNRGMDGADDLEVKLLSISLGDEDSSKDRVVQLITRSDQEDQYRYLCRQNKKNEVYSRQGERLRHWKETNTIDEVDKLQVEVIIH